MYICVLFIQKFTLFISQPSGHLGDSIIYCICEIYLRLYWTMWIDVDRCGIGLTAQIHFVEKNASLEQWTCFDYLSWMKLIKYI